MSYTPYGYRIERGKAVPAEPEVTRLHSFFQHYLDGMSISDAARSAGVNRSLSCCRAMLQNKTYLGTDYYPAIVSPELFHQLGKERFIRSAAKRHTPRKPRPQTPIQTRFSPPNVENVVSAQWLYHQIAAIPNKRTGDK